MTERFEQWSHGYFIEISWKFHGYFVINYDHAAWIFHDTIWYFRCSPSSIRCIWMKFIAFWSLCMMGRRIICHVQESSTYMPCMNITVLFWDFLWPMHPISTHPNQPGVRYWCFAGWKRNGLDMREHNSKTLTHIDRLFFIYCLWPSKLYQLVDLWFWYNYWSSNHRQSAAEASRPPAHRQSLPQVRLRVTGSRYQSCAAGSIQIWAEEILAGFSAWPTGLYLSPQAQQDCAVAWWFLDNIRQPKRCGLQDSVQCWHFFSYCILPHCLDELDDEASTERLWSPNIDLRSLQNIAEPSKIIAELCRTRLHLEINQNCAESQQSCFCFSLAVLKFNSPLF